MHTIRIAEDFPTNAVEFEQRFGTEEACRAYVMQVRWPQGWRCPRCGHDKGWTTQRHLWHCARCAHQCSLTAGTIFHGSKKPLRLWFKALYLATAAKNGVSAKTLQRDLGVSYTTAWTWLHKIRQAISLWNSGPLTGVVEVDETLLGTDESQAGGRHKGDKAIVVIGVEEKGPTAMGRARMEAVPDFSAASLHGFVERHVGPGSGVRTDGWSGYEGLDKKGYAHEVHVLDGPGGEPARQARAKESFGRVHLLTSLLKRWLLGTHQGAVREKHLQAYLDEFVFRFNRRASHWRTLLFERLMERAVTLKPRPYWRIVGRTAPDRPLHLALA